MSVCSGEEEYFKNKAMESIACSCHDGERPWPFPGIESYRGGPVDIPIREEVIDRSQEGASVMAGDLRQWNQETQDRGHTRDNRGQQREKTKFGRQPTARESGDKSNYVHNQYNKDGGEYDAFEDETSGDEDAPVSRKTLWEMGEADYMNVDKFDNILDHLKSVIGEDLVVCQKEKGSPNGWMNRKEVQKRAKKMMKRIDEKKALYRQLSQDSTSSTDDMIYEIAQRLAREMALKIAKRLATKMAKEMAKKKARRMAKSMVRKYVLGMQLKDTSRRSTFSES